MKQEQHNIDNLFNQGFQDFEPNVPPPVWDNVQARLQKRKRRRLLPLFWVSSLIGVGLLGYYLGNNQPYELATPKIQTVKEKQQSETFSTIYSTEGNQENKLSEINTFKKVVIPVRNSDKSHTAIFNSTTSDFEVSNLLDNKNNTENSIGLASNFSNRQNISTNSIEKLLPQPVKWSKNIQIKKAQKEDCYAFQKKNWLTPAIEAYVGGVYVQPRFSTKSNEPNSYKTVRDSSEKYVLAVDAGIWFNPVHRSGIGIRTGLHASRWIEKLDRINAYEEKYQMIVTQVKDNQGNIIRNDTSLGWVRGRLVQKYYNHYTALNIPLQVGFEYLKPNRTQYFAYAGAMLNLRFWSKGEIYDTSEKIISFPNSNKVFETNIGVSLIGHVGMRHRLSEHWWLTESLQCNYTLNNITDKVHPLEQRNINAGVQVGLRYKF